MDDYIIPQQTKIGHIHLKVLDLDKAMKFYCDLLGFSVTVKYGSSAVFLSAGGYHHHIGLNTWRSRSAPPAPVNTCGLYHAAILYDIRRALAVALQRLLDAGHPLTGVADHGVSEAIYLNDPDGNGIELYWDRPRETWPLDDLGNIQMFTDPLDLKDLLREINA